MNSFLSSRRVQALNWFWPIGFVCVFGLAWFSWSCAREGAVGDGWLSDQGFGSYYPRRRIILPPITVGAQTVERVFQLRDVPKDFYTVWVVPFPGRKGPLLAWNRFFEYCRKTRLSAELIVTRLDSNPRAHRAFGRLLEERCEKWNIDGFEQGGYGQELAFVGGTLHSIMLREQVEIKVRFWVEDTTPDLATTKVQLVLVAGGFRI